MIKVAAFDIGKVLLDFDYGIFVRRMAPRTRMDVPALDAFLNQSPLLAQYESGQLTSPEFFAVVQKETGFDGTESEFAANLKLYIFSSLSECVSSTVSDGLSASAREDQRSTRFTVTPRSDRSNFSSKKLCSKQLPPGPARSS